MVFVFVRKNEKMGEEEELLLVWDYIFFSMCVLNKSPIFTMYGTDITSN